MNEFVEFPKMARLKRGCCLTEKIDGSNAQVILRSFTASDYSRQPDHCIARVDDWMLFAGSRNRIITPTDDNFGFAKWVADNAEELTKLGQGNHYGEWWGSGIQRRYGLDHKRFSLFNVNRWSDDAARPACCHVVPVLYRGDFNTDAIDGCIKRLATEGSVAAPGFMNAEGVVVWHDTLRVYAKQLIENDSEPKSRSAA